MNGLDNLEGDAQWAGEDGLHDAWIADPETDVNTVGLRTENIEEEKIERGSEHDSPREALIGHNGLVCRFDRTYSVIERKGLFAHGVLGDSLRSSGNYLVTVCWWLASQYIAVETVRPQC